MVTILFLHQTLLTAEPELLRREKIGTVTRRYRITMIEAVENNQKQCASLSKCRKLETYIQESSESECFRKLSPLQ